MVCPILSSSEFNVPAINFSRRVEALFKIQHHSPRDAIVEEAERWGADLIVVGSHGYRGPERALLGSVSQAVATQAKCSVEIARRRHVEYDDEC